jgi:hypothetical protein
MTKFIQAKHLGEKNSGNPLIGENLQEWAIKLDGNFGIMITFEGSGDKYILDKKFKSFNGVKNAIEKQKIHPSYNEVAEYEICVINYNVTLAIKAITWGELQNRPI